MGHPRDPGARPRPALIAALQRALRPPRTLRPTRAGWAFTALTLGVGFAALNTGNNLLYLVLSFMLAFLVLSGVLSESALRRIEVRRRLPAELLARAPARVVIEVHNPSRRVPAFAVVVEDLAPRRRRDRPGPALGRVFLLRVGPGETVSRTYRLVADRRGPLVFGGYRISTRFPFGLFSKSRIDEDPAQTLVYPELVPVPPAPTGGRLAPGADAGGPATGAGVEASGLRGFVPGDPARRIHWRASLRRGALLVRETEDQRPAEVEVRLRTRGVTPGPAFEARVRDAASEVAARLSEGLRVALATDAAAFPAGEGPRQRARLLGFLALVDADPTPSGVGP